MKRLTLLEFGAAAALITAAAAMIAAPSPAQACGGFFCSQQPIDQMGEQILFGSSGGTVTAQIMIQYTGEAKDFAWILPVASKPELSLGTVAAFQTLGWSTAPSYWLEWDYSENSCGGWQIYPSEATVDADTDGGGGGVTVVESKEVGPFETVILQSNSTDELIQWLGDNGYDQPPESTPLIAHYVEKEMMFVALRLKQNEGVGAIQPITLTFSEQDPCVPLVLTQVAAVPDMPVQLYLLGDHRTVPSNWMHVVLNEKKLNWMGNASNYVDVVTQAINEASGHGFVTEYAGTSDIMSGRLYTEDRFDLDTLASLSDPAAFVREMLRQGFPRDATMQGLLRKHVPMPASLVAQGVEERAFYNNLEEWSEALADLDFDAAAFVTDLEERVIAPLRESQSLLDSLPYLTRLFATVSPDEMDRDPVFVQNADLPDVSNRHTAQAQAICGDADPDQLEGVMITLESGERFTLQGPFDNYWWANNEDFKDPAPTEPAAARIELIGQTGPPTLLDPSQVDQVDALLNVLEPYAVLDEVASGTVPITPRAGSATPTADSGCSGGHRPSGALMVLFVFGLFLVPRTRRQPQRDRSL